MRDQLEQMRDRAALIAAAASLSAGACGEAGGGTGYGVVDPLPAPYCEPTVPGAYLGGVSTFGDQIDVRLVLSNRPPTTVAQVTASDGVTSLIETASDGERADVFLRAPDGGWPDEVHVKIALACIGQSGGVGINLELLLDTSMVDHGQVPFTILGGPEPMPGMPVVVDGG